MLTLVKKIYQDENAFRATIVLSILAVGIYFLLAKLSGILWPFIAAILLAALLNPCVCGLRKIGISRGLGSAILILLLVLIFLMVGGVISFFVQKYIVYYSHNINKTIAFVADWVPKTLSIVAKRIHLPFAIHADRIHEYVMNSFGLITEIFVHYVFSLFDTAKSVVGIFSFLFLVPILTFYLLKDWLKLIATTKEYTPSQVVHFAEFAFPKVKTALLNQVSGQAKVACILTLIYSPCLFALGLKPYLLLGFLSGISTFIPFLGIFIAFLISFIAALGHGLSIVPLILLMVLYFVVSSIDSNFLTPKLIGEKVGLHPVWIFFAVFATLAVFGIGGAFFIMPIATAIGSFVHSGIDWLNQMERKNKKNLVI